MRDWAILWILGALIGLSWRRPWLGVMALAVWAYMQPQAYGWGTLRDIPVFLILFTAVCAATAYAAWRRELTLPEPDWRLFLLGLLWLWFGITTWQALFPAAAWIKLIEVSKVLLPLTLTLLLIDSRAKLLGLLAAIALAIGLVTLKGGYWAIVNGLGDRVYGPPGSQYYDNNHFAVLMIMNIPLLLLLAGEARDRSLRMVLLALVGVHYVAVISSWSRGALLALGVTTLLLLWQARRRWLVLGLLGVGVVSAFVLVPADWFERMGSIAAAGADESAQTRLAVWRIGLQAALEHPLFGIGFEGWRVVAGTASGRTTDWHSIYIEILAEHGFIGLLLWGALLLATLFGLTRLTGAARCGRAPDWAGRYAALLRTALVAYAVGGAFLGISYWDIFYHLLLIAALLFSLVRQAQRTTAKSATFALYRSVG